MDSALEEWYRPRRGAYPWRRPRPDPYHVLVSEIMLQQTQASRVTPAFVSFIRRFPTVADLATAPRADVLRAWGTLGYNRRAIALAEAARTLLHDHGGQVPSDPPTLRTLPGVGPYTAAAVAALAFGLSLPAVDTNVARVVARSRLGSEAFDVPSLAVEKAAASWLAHSRRPAGEWNQAVMDLGREVCRSRPRCGICPLRRRCAFRRSGEPWVGRDRSAGRPRPQSPFEGSFRQVRGAVLRTLRETSPLSLGAVVRRCGHPRERVAAAVTALAADGVVVAGPAALDGRPGGRVRLAD